MFPADNQCDASCIHIENALFWNNKPKIKLQWTQDFPLVYIHYGLHKRNDWLQPLRNCPFSKKQEHKNKRDSLLKHTDLHGCKLCGMLHRCRSQKQYHRGENKRAVCYVSVSLVLLPVMHNECPRHALSIEFKYKLTRVSLTWLPGLGPNSICVKASVPLLCLQLGSKPWKQPIGRA